jgi:hypothetical protein
MSTSSPARQIDADFSGATGGLASSSTAVAGPGIGNRATGDIIDLPRFPKFTYTTRAEAAASRIANRVNARAITDADHKLLLNERQELLDKELAGSITPEEKNRLAYVRWSLDRVDDARFGADLDRLESVVHRYERFQQDIEQFRRELERLSKARRTYP